MAAFPKYNFFNCPTTGSYLVSTGRGTLHTMTINTTAAAAITIYDGINTAGKKIATLAASPAIGSTFLFDVEFSQGLLVVLAGASDVTLSIGG